MTSAGFPRSIATGSPKAGHRESGRLGKSNPAIRIRFTGACSTYRPATSDTWNTSVQRLPFTRRPHGTAGAHPCKSHILRQRRGETRGHRTRKVESSCSGHYGLRSFNTAQSPASSPASGKATLASGQLRSSLTGLRSKEAIGSGSAAKVKRSQAGAWTTGHTTEISSGSVRTAHQNEKCTTAVMGMKCGVPRMTLTKNLRPTPWTELTTKRGAVGILELRSPLSSARHQNPRAGCPRNTAHAFRLLLNHSGGPDVARERARAESDSDSVSPPKQQRRGHDH